MATTATRGPKHVNTTIRYFDDPGVPLSPRIIGGPGPLKLTPKVDNPVTVTDVTGNEDKYKLDVNGFQFVKHASQFSHSLAGLKSRYSVKEELDETTQGHYVEMETLLREVLAKTRYPKPSSVHILTHIIREGPKDGEPSRGPSGPLYGVHVDQSVVAARGVAERWLGDAAAELLNKPRYQIVNLWRPVKPITRDPFGVTDAMTVPDDDIVPVPLIFPDHKAEALECRPATDPLKPHRWYYKSEQQPDDVLLFIQVDSTKKQDMPRRCPHAAFKDPDADEASGEPRISIEVRAMVFYDED
ncbi:unnamed protein product [Discula destructiva]